MTLARVMSRDVGVALALVLGALAGAPAQALAAPGDAFARGVAKCGPAPDRSVPFQVSGALTFAYTDAAVPSVLGGDNYSGPGLAVPQTTEPGLEVCMTWAPSPDVGLFADLSASAPSDSSASISVDRLYLDVSNTFGVQNLRFRVGRDQINLGPMGLLLNEEDLGDQRDGFQMWLPSIGPVRLFGFYQYTHQSLSTTRRVGGGRAESEISPGVTLGVNYRADIAAAADMGSCPSVDCNTGGGSNLDDHRQSKRGPRFSHRDVASERQALSRRGK